MEDRSILSNLIKIVNLRANGIQGIIKKSSYLICGNQNHVRTSEKDISQLYCAYNKLRIFEPLDEDSKHYCKFICESSSFWQKVLPS